MDKTVPIVSRLVESTAETLRNSFTNYWPANEQNDPVERNASVHFSHAMLSAGFSVFAEADHPNPNIYGIDVLGFSPGNDWLLACEFKQLHSSEKVRSVIEDLGRLDSFRLRTDFPDDSYGEGPAATVRKCRNWFGFVGGLHFARKSESSNILDIWNRPDRLSPGTAYFQLAEEFTKRRAFLPEPQIVVERPTGDRYYLLGALFQISPAGVLGTKTSEI